jgi:pentatricopeptide repeat protein
MGAIDKGEKIHCEIVRRGLLNTHIVLGNSLVDMYSKCGVVALARQTLEELLVRDVVTWNALISGYAQQGMAYEALNCFEHMCIEGLSPNEVTFLCVLAACNHLGRCDEAEMLFGTMTRTFRIIPSIEHYTCMVAVYGFSGHFDKVKAVIRVVPSYDYPLLWLALLGACRIWGNVTLGRLAFDQIIQLDSSCATAYLLMSCIFSASEMQADAENIQAMRLKYVARKVTISQPIRQCLLPSMYKLLDTLDHVDGSRSSRY